MRYGDKEIRDYLLNNLSPDRRNEFERELSTNHSLKSRVEFYQNLIRSGNQLPPEIIQEQRDDLARNLRRRKFRYLLRLLFGIVLIAVILVFAIVKYEILSDQLPTSIKQSIETASNRILSFGGKQEQKFLDSYYGDIGLAIHYTPENNIIIAGDYYKEMMLGGITLINPYLTQGAFIASLTPDFDVLWIKHIGGKGGRNYISRIQMDGSGNVFVGGRISEDGLIGNHKIDIKGHAGIGPEDFFLLKLDESGDFQWILNDGGQYVLGGNAGSGTVQDLVIDERNDLYVTGQFGGDTLFGQPVKIEGDPITFISKVGRDGSVMWTETIMGSYGIIPVAIKLFHGELFILGHFGHHNLDGNIQLPDTTIEVKGGRDVFLTKYDTSGNYQWVKTFGSETRGLHFGSDIPTDMTINIDGQVIIVGTHTGEFEFDGHIINHENARDGFLFQLDLNGELGWAKSFNGPESLDFPTYRGDQPQDVECDGLNNIYISGQFSGSVRFEDVLLSAQGSNDIFLAKYDASGSLLWVRQMGGDVISPLNDLATDLIVDDYGKIYLIGSFSGTMEIDGQSLTAQGERDIFIAIFNAEGGLLELNVLFA